MRIGSRFPFFVAFFLAMTILGCSLGSPTRNPASDPPAVDPTSMTTTPIIQTPTATISADHPPIADVLTETEIIQILRTSFAAYPWHMNQTVLSGETQQSSTTLTEAQWNTRGYDQFVQAFGAGTVTIESILIDSEVYLKITGSGVAESYGLVDGQWVEVSPDNPLWQLADPGALDTEKIVETFAAEFAALSAEGGMDELQFKHSGPEEVNGIQTNLYESAGATFTYRLWIGADQRLYKMIMDMSVGTRTVLIEYDPGINIQPPIP